MASNVRSFALLASHLKNHRSNCLLTTAKNGVLLNHLYELEGETRESVASESQLLADGTSGTK